VSAQRRRARVATRRPREAQPDGREVAYAQLVEPHRAELRAHCARMLGSPHDAEDALQDALVRAWRGLPKLRGRGAVRSWLYRIATNASLDAISRRRNRAMPLGHRPVADPADDPGGQPIEDVGPSPEARCEERESIELAFAAALELLPPQQSAVLVLREALGFSARDTAAALEVTVASVNSALQRARATLKGTSFQRLEQESSRALGDERLREQVGRYVNAWERHDVEAVVSMLVEGLAPRLSSTSSRPSASSP
jgi:RNA polymerase sigma-70 factor, ECF subfamily